MRLNYSLYEVKGKNSLTNRSRTKVFEARIVEDVLKDAISEGFSNDITITLLPFAPPTQKQLLYAKELNIDIPEGTCIHDVSELIRNKVEGDSTPNTGLLTYAHDKGINFSCFIGKKSLYDLVFHKLEGIDKISFFIFCIYRYLSEDREGNLNASKHKIVINEYANSKINDKKFINSLEKYSGRDLRYFGKIRVDNDDSSTYIWGGSTTTHAYKETVNFLHDTFGINKTKTKTIKT